MGLGAFPGDDPLFLGMLGMHGTYTANMAMNEADCILAVGARFDDRVTGKVDSFAPRASVIHLDVDAAEINKNVRAHWPIVADARVGLRRLVEEARQYLAEGHRSREELLDKWWLTIRGWSEKHPLGYEDRPGLIMPQRLVQELGRLAPPEAIFVTDVGQHQMWAAQYLVITRPRLWVTSGGLGTMGFGLPAAIGAQIANPGTPVIAIVGDGSFQMTMQELALLMEGDLPVKIVISNNHFLGMVRQWQDLFYQKRFTATDLSRSPNFVLLAQAYGIPAARVSDPGELEAALGCMLSQRGPYLLDVAVDHEAHVYPMVPGGAPTRDMILGTTAKQ
jgi:acetolactate synthase-1/2/3 large subunit